MSWVQRLFKKSYNGGIVTLSSALSLLSTLAVTGASAFTGAVSCASTLAVTGASVFTGLVTVANFTATGTVTICGVTFSAYAGTPEAHVTGNRKGDFCLDYTNGAAYVFAGTAAANTGWKLVTQAS